MEDPIQILIVEDSATQAEALAYALEQNQYQPTIKANGLDALTWLAFNRPALVISDVIMPGMDGYELCRRIKSDSQLQQIPVILMTQLSDPEDIIKGIECGADNFIVKPLDEEYLLARLSYILALKDSHNRQMMNVDVELFFAGKAHRISAPRMQILNLLFAAFETVVQRHRELQRVNAELKEASDTIDALQGLIPICAWCKKVRNDQGYWQKVETYLQEHSSMQFSHGACPECREKFVAEIKAREGQNKRD